MAGLLHDIGTLIIFNRLPELSAENLAASGGDEERLYEMERQTLGFTHAEVGSLLFTLWQLPPALHGAVRGHHEVSRTAVGEVEASIVRVANLFANASEFGSLHPDPRNAEPPSEHDWGSVGLSAATLDAAELAIDIAEKTSETLDLIAARR